MLVLGIESSCDETGIALYDTLQGLLAHTLHSQVEMHAEYGGVVPELASRDHIRRVLPLTESALKLANKSLADINAIAYTQGPGLAGALLVGTSIAQSLSFALNIPSIAIHHLEGHLLAPLLEPSPPKFPFVALLVSGGHSQLMRVDGVGQYTLLGDTLDDAAGEAFDKTAKLLGLGYPGGPALSKLADSYTKPNPSIKLPRPMLHSGDLDFSFSGLKTAVLTLVNQQKNLQADAIEGVLDAQVSKEIAWEFQEAVTEILTAKCLNALKETKLKSLIVSGGVGANLRLRTRLDAAAAKHNLTVRYPRLEFCTDNGAMIAFAGAMRLQAQGQQANQNAAFGTPQMMTPHKDYAFSIKPRWDLAQLSKP